MYYLNQFGPVPSRRGQKPFCVYRRISSSTSPSSGDQDDGYLVDAFHCITKPCISSEMQGFQTVDKPTGMNQQRCVIAISGFGAAAPIEYRQPEGGMYGRRLPIPYHMQDCSSIRNGRALCVLPCSLGSFATDCAAGAWLIRPVHRRCTNPASGH